MNVVRRMTSGPKELDANYRGSWALGNSTVARAYTTIRDPSAGRG